MNERLVAVSTVTGSKICGCFSKPRRNCKSRGRQESRPVVVSDVC